MLVLDKKQIEEVIDLNGMMDQIEEAYRIFGSGDFYYAAKAYGRR